MRRKILSESELKDRKKEWKRREYEKAKSSGRIARYHERNRERLNAYQRQKQHQLLLKYKAEIFRHFGYKCARCGFSDTRALQIDHPHGGGRQERKQKSAGVSYYRFVLDHIENYQLLCANCNWIKREENDEIHSMKEDARRPLIATRKDLISKKPVLEDFDHVPMYR